MADHGPLQSLLVFLLAAVIAVPLFNRLKLGAVLAYLVAGALVGPHALGLIDADIRAFALGELGVVMLLFIIGLELSPSRLWLMRRAVFGIGAMQVLASFVVLALLGVAIGLPWKAVAVAAFALAMSSTAIGVQLLAERKELGQAHGRAALGVLLFQDIVAIPAIAIIPLLGEAAATPGLNLGSTLTGIAKVLAAVGAVILTGRYLLRPVFRYVAQTRSVEAFTAVTLLVALGTAWLTSLAGISMAMGAFLGGLMLAESEFRHEIEANLEPFKGLLLGVFFLAVGLSVDWAHVAREAPQVAAGVVVLLAVKIGVLYAIGRRAAALGREDALRLALVLCQGGEFAFVLLSVAAGAALVADPLHDVLTAVVVLSMAATPLLLLGFDRLPRRGAADAARPFDAIPEEERSRVIIAGFGRVGQIVARVLRAQHIPFTALEHSVEQVDTSRRFGNRLYYGDPSRPELLRAARAEHAEIFVLATDDPEANVRTARLVKRLYPHLKVYARARNRQHAYRLMDLQVNSAVRETFHSSLVLAQQVLEALGVPAAQARERVERFREHDERLLEVQYAFHDDEAKLVQSAHEALAELEQLFDADREQGRA